MGGGRGAYVGRGGGGGTPSGRFRKLGIQAKGNRPYEYSGLRPIFPCENYASFVIGGY